MTKAVESGMPKLRIEEAAARRQARVDRGEDVVVGVNKYVPDDPELVDVLDIDNTEVREQQIARLERDPGRARRRRRAEPRSTPLTEGAAGDGNLLALAIDAARARATVGEISDAMETVFGRHTAEIRTHRRRVRRTPTRATTTSPRSRRDDRRLRRRPRAAGPACSSSRWARTATTAGAKVIATAFADLGFDVDVGPLFQTPAEAARDAVENDVHVVGVSQPGRRPQDAGAPADRGAAEGRAPATSSWCAAASSRRRTTTCLDATPASPPSSARAPTSPTAAARGARPCSSSAPRPERPTATVPSTRRCADGRSRVGGSGRRPAGPGPGHHARRVDPGRSPRRRPTPLLDALLPDTGRRGPHRHQRAARASGKSTFIEALGLAPGRRRATGSRCSPSIRRAVAPAGRSSATRPAWSELARQPEAFIRPSPAGGQLGGRRPPHPRGDAAVRGGRLRRRDRRDGRRRPVRDRRRRHGRPLRAARGARRRRRAAGHQARDHGAGRPRRGQQGRRRPGPRGRAHPGRLRRRAPPPAPEVAQLGRPRSSRARRSRGEASPRSGRPSSASSTPSRARASSRRPVPARRRPGCGARSATPSSTGSGPTRRCGRCCRPPKPPLRQAGPPRPSLPVGSSTPSVATEHEERLSARKAYTTFSHHGGTAVRTTDTNSVTPPTQKVLQLGIAHERDRFIAADVSISGEHEAKPNDRRRHDSFTTRVPPSATSAPAVVTNPLRSAAGTSCSTSSKTTRSNRLDSHREVVPRPRAERNQRTISLEHEPGRSADVDNPIKLCVW